MSEKPGLVELLNKGSATFRKLNAHLLDDDLNGAATAIHAAIQSALDCGTPESTKPQRAVRNAALGKAKGKAGNPARFALRVTSYRRRLLDPDNLCPKYFIDGLRYAGLLPGDTAEHITLSVTQEKVRRSEDERTEILIEPIAASGDPANV